MRTKLTIISLIFIFTLFSGFGCRCESSEVTRAMQPIKITYWRVFDGQDVFSDILLRYKAIHPFITIDYRKLRYDEFEEELINAFAADRGPDIFSIHNTWMKKYHGMGLLAPMPTKITMAYPVVKGSIKKEIVPEIRTTNSISLKKIKSDYVDVVYDDVVISEFITSTGIHTKNVYGLPLFVDTLAMFYNRALFNNASITTPPEFWNREFQQNVKKLTKQNNKGQIIQSGVAMGGGANIERAGDILSILMMQNGTQMLSEQGRVSFEQKPDTFESKAYNPGLDAVRFYSDFSNPAKEVYCWNSTLENSMELFLQNKLSIMFGYSYMIPEIKSKAPKLKFSIAKLPQIEGNPQSINFANYWNEVVSNKSEHIGEAWDFIQFATRAEQAKSYIDKAEKPPALRSLIDGVLENQNIGVFAEQVLTAESWYKGAGAIATEKILEDMIDSIAIEQSSIESAIKLASKKIQQTIIDKPIY